jgi:hypothetical protein
LNAAENDFTRLQFGGATSLFPALQRVSASIAVVDATGGTSGSLLINTTSSAGYALDVNGTARVLISSSTVSPLSLRNNNTAGTVDVALYNSAGSAVGAFGYAGSTYSGTPLQDKVYFYASRDFIITPNGVTNYFRVNTSTGNILINTTTDSGYKLDVSGSTRVQGSAFIGPSEIRPFSSSITANPTGGNIAIIPNNVSNTLIDSTGAIFLRSSTVAITSNLFTLCSIQTVFSPTSGTGINNNLVIHPIISQSGGANGITRGLYINPTLTSAADWRAIEVTSGSVLFGTSGSGCPRTGAIGAGSASGSAVRSRHCRAGWK